jgi:phosphoribosylglycinamide formyltransferase-1
MIKLAIMISGRGSNMLALADSIDALDLPAVITKVISNQACAGIDSAAARGLPVDVIKRTAFDSRHDHDMALAQAIDISGADFVFLAGYMAILGPAFVEHYAGRLINIHPSLLPAYKGLDTHQRALDDGAADHGATVHLVTAELDAGPIIAQAGLAVAPQDTAQGLAARVLVLEHQIYPFVLASLASGRLRLSSAGPFWHDRDGALAAMPDSMQRILAPSLLPSP